jgi:glyoxylase-like metal-dependent hydrolase (beta-lactamase superfamily II)
MEIKRFVLGSMAVNSYLLVNNREAILVDVAAGAGAIIEYLQAQRIELKAILITHGHFDHISGVDQVVAKFDVPAYIHHSEANWLVNPALNGSGSFAFFKEVSIKTNPIQLYGDSKLKISDFVFDVIHTPGHTPGGLSYIIGSRLFTGDTLFRDSIGRTDLGAGNYQQIIASISDKLFKLDDNLIVLPGHGEESSIGYEKAHNPYVTDLNRL